MKNYLYGFICLLFCLCASSNFTNAQSCADGSISYDDDIASILTTKCGGCHGAQGGYSVATYASTIAGGNNCGPAVTPGDASAAASSLIDKTQWVNGGAAATCGANMPTNGSPANTLTAAEFTLIESWINAGAQESCPALPTNNVCVDAIALTVDATNTCVAIQGDNTNASDSAELPAPTCASYSGADVWFSVIVPASGNVTIENDSDGVTAITDMGMNVYSGACGGLTQIECDDDDGNGAFSLIELTGQTPGDVLLVRVWEFGGNVEGTFNICAYEPPPPPQGDECADPLPYPGDVAAGTCVTGFDFTVFSDGGVASPSPTCDFGGDNVVWFSWTAPVVTTAGDPLDLLFDDGNGQALDCDIGIEVYETDCITTASNCLGNVSGTLTGVVQGNSYLLLIYDDSPGTDPSCDFCLSVACSAPIATAVAACQIGDEANFYVDVDVTSLGVGNTDYTVTVGGVVQANITATGMVTYGPFPSGTPVDVVLTGVADATCAITIAGLDAACVCDPLAVDAGTDGLVCAGDSFNLSATLNTVIPGGFIDYTVTNAASGSCTATPDAAPTVLALGDDSGSGSLPLGFNFDFFGTTYTDVCVGSNGYATLTCVDETDLSEDPLGTATDPNAIIALFWDDLDPGDGGTVSYFNSTIGGQTCFVIDFDQVIHCCSAPNETVTGQIILCPDNTVTINCIDCQSDGGTDTAIQGIENEDGTLGYFDPAFPDGVVPAVATTANCVTFTPNVQPATACNFVGWVTDINDITGTTVATTEVAVVNPTITTSYFAIVECNGVQCFDEVVATIDVPANCINCTIDNVLVDNIVCSDAGTPADSADDTYTFDVTVTATDGDATGYTFGGDLSGTGTYATAVSQGPFLISGGDIAFTVTDAVDLTCTSNGSAIAPSTCSGATCSITPDAASNIVCDDNGTAGDPSDDTYTFDILVNGNSTFPGATNTFSDDQGNTGIAYGTTVSYGPFTIAGGNITVNFTDTEETATCTSSMMATVPVTCSGATCSITPDTASNIVCDDNGTPGDSSDDTYTFDILVNGNSTFPGATNTFSDDQGNTGIAYGTTVSYGPFPIAGGNITVNFTDFDETGCTGSMMATTPATCSAGICEDMVNYTVTATSCDMTGATIELQDNLGNVITTAPLGVDGSMGSFGLLACADYQIVITGAPLCYTDEGGDVGPRGFIVDGSGQFEVALSTNVESIPTLSEWGLITLALLLMSYGSIVMAGAGSLAGANNMQLPVSNFQLPFNAAILRKAFMATIILAAVGYTLSIVLFGAIFFSDIVGVAIAGPVFAYLAHLLYLIEKNNK